MPKDNEAWLRDIQPTVKSAGETFVYQGVDIQTIGPLLNMTDMWHAAGALASKYPSNWLRLPDADEFRIHLLQHLQNQGEKHSKLPFDIMGLSHNFLQASDGLVFSQRGRSGTTWAHWQIALSYAQYLSKPFHIWCNEVVAQAMAKNGRPRLRSKLSRNVSDQLRSIQEKLEEMTQAAESQHGHEMFLLLSQKELFLEPGRREFSPSSRALICRVINSEPYEGRCPACHRTKVIDVDGKPTEGAEFDHFWKHSLNRPEWGWLICHPCHLLMTRGGLLARIGAIPHHRRFQDLLKDRKEDERPEPFSIPGSR